MKKLLKVLRKVVDVLPGKVVKGLSGVALSVALKVLSSKLRFHNSSVCVVVYQST